MKTPDGARSALPVPANGFETRLQDLLGRVADRTVSVADATSSLRDLPFRDLAFARVDHHRELRQGTTEIVYAVGKTLVQLRDIVSSLLERNDGPVLVTRATDEQRRLVRECAVAAGLPVGESVLAGTIAIMRNVPPTDGRVLILTAGTADLAVAEEAALTASMMGSQVELRADVGVAGLHRLAAVRADLDDADVLVVVAGMEGALPSVVGGLVAVPVIACPTSVGYGASFGGLAALLSMLNSCTPGVLCVNIDDGVGAGFGAALIARRRIPSARRR